MLPENDNIHFVAYGLPQYKSSEFYKFQIIKHNSFLHNLAVIPIVIIDSYVMYQELYSTLVAKDTIRGIEETHLTYSSEKAKTLSARRYRYAYQRMRDFSRTWETTWTHLQQTKLKRRKENNENMTDPPVSSQKRPVSISYDWTNETATNHQASTKSRNEK